MGVSSSSVRAPPTSADASDAEEQTPAAAADLVGRGAAATRMHSTAGRVADQARPRGKAERRPVDLAAGRVVHVEVEEPAGRKRGLDVDGRALDAVGRQAGGRRSPTDRARRSRRPRAGAGKLPLEPSRRPCARGSAHPAGTSRAPGMLTDTADDAAPGAARLRHRRLRGRPGPRAVRDAAPAARSSASRLSTLALPAPSALSAATPESPPGAASREPTAVSSLHLSDDVDDRPVAVLDERDDLVLELERPGLAGERVDLGLELADVLHRQAPAQQFLLGGPGAGRRRDAALGHHDVDRLAGRGDRRHLVADDRQAPADRRRDDDGQLGAGRRVASARRCCAAGSRSTRC